MATEEEKSRNNEVLLSPSNDSSTEKLRRTLTQFPSTGPTGPPAETTEIRVSRLTFTKIILLGACANLTMLSSGFSFNAMSISLDMAARDLGIAEKDLQWTFNALYLAMGCTTLVAGRTADIFGRKAVYLVGIALFGIFSLVASFMHNPEGFFINRAMSGLGVAMILASNAGYYCLINVFSTWRSAFWCLAATTVLPFMGTALFVKNRPILAEQADRRIDWIGGFLFTAGFALLFYPLSQARSTPKGWATGCEWLTGWSRSEIKCIASVLTKYLFSDATDIIAMLVLSFVLVGSALCWQWYLEHETTFPPVIRTSVLTRSRGKLALVCFVVVSSLHRHFDRDEVDVDLRRWHAALFYGLL
ncbi:hypothetical protein QFC21_003816 [Naganishia friedmannii]|uniref:Uncharacterized protein n=1 Tax=Naganishia friedmannii TaxID=89922 RepID=A0ACC2VL39_9TREE|nr:hypothetical protein QFC21_003816 [Naganishia friedmannii]